MLDAQIQFWDMGGIKTQGNVMLPKEHSNAFVKDPKEQSHRIPATELKRVIINMLREA